MADLRDTQFELWFCLRRSISVEPLTQSAMIGGLSIDKLALLL